MIPPVLFTMPDTPPQPQGLPALPGGPLGFAALLTEQLPQADAALPEAAPPTDGDEAAPPLDTGLPLPLMALFQPPPQPEAAAEAAAPLPEAPPAEPPPATMAAPPMDEAALAVPAEALTEAPLPEPVVLAESDGFVLPAGEGASPAGPSRSLTPAEGAPPPTTVAVESGEEPQVQIRPEGLEKLSMRVQEGGEQFDVEIERGVDRTLDIRVVAPPEAIEELAAMESELSRSLEERAMRLGSFAAEARAEQHDASGEGQGGEGADGEASSVDDESAPVPEQLLGLLNIRA